MNATEPSHDVELAEARSAVYRFLLTALDKPTWEQHAWLTGPDFRRALATACAPFGLACPDGELFPAALADYESRYLACFEVGLPAAPVPLLASHYDPREPVPRIIHEHTLFYRLFGALPAADAEPADHLLNELAFLLRLDGLLLGGETAAGPIVLARRDFLERRMARWPERAASVAEEKGLPPVYRVLLALLARAVRQDLELSKAAVAGLERGPA
jgi:hypothetical protein